MNGRRLGPGPSLDRDVSSRDEEDESFLPAPRRSRRNRGPDVEVRGLEEAQELILDFLVATVGEVKVETIVAQIFQQGFSGNAPFHQFEFDAKDDLEEISERVIEIAQRDIESCGAHRIVYSLVLAQHNGRRNFPLRVIQGGSSDGEMMGVSEADMVPMSRNIIAQQMQHNQVLIQTSVGTYAEQIRMLLDTLDKKERRIEFLEGERQRYLDAREAVLSLQHQRNMEARQQEKSDFRMDQLTSTAMNALAPVVNKFVKQKLLPEKASPLEGMMIALGSTLKPEQVQNLIQSGIFDPAQLANFMQIFQAIHDSFEEEKRKHTNGVEPGHGIAVSTPPAA